MECGSKLQDGGCVHSEQLQEIDRDVQQHSVQHRRDVGAEEVVQLVGAVQGQNLEHLE